jgi:predicted nucleic acid-binding protein
MKAVFDTNILIDYLSGADAARTELDRYTDKLISSITWMEILIGARNAAEEDVIELFLRDFVVVPISREVARGAVAIRRSRKLRFPDAVIWASAQTQSALLVTRNTRDFPKDDPGVRVPY